MCCTCSTHSPHYGPRGHQTLTCHSGYGAHGHVMHGTHAHYCMGHGHPAPMAHTGCCRPSSADRQAWLERRLEALREQAKAVEEQIAALAQEGPEETEE